MRENVARWLIKGATKLASLLIKCDHIDLNFAFMLKDKKK